MGIEHINRMGDRYYLLAGTSTRKTPYFSRKPRPPFVDVIPDGYEVYELPDVAQVVLRKTKPTQITISELRLVENAVRNEAGIEFFCLDVEPANLTIYITDGDDDRLDEMYRGMGVDSRRVAELIRKHKQRSRYNKVMRFNLIDEKTRMFGAERWCFLGSIDDWWSLHHFGQLNELVAKYVKHLGKESFFELM